MRPSLIDTDILSEFLKKRNSTVVRKAAEYLAQHRQFAISAITQYEVMRGLKATNARRQLEKFGEFCLNANVYPISAAILDRTSDLWVAARKGGHSGRDPDLIIAATALEHGRVLITGNVAHFSWISDLSIENWRDP